MALVEINFDGIVGPSHNYAGLSLGNLASTRNAGAVSQPRRAALEVSTAQPDRNIAGERGGLEERRARRDRPTR